MTWLVRNWHLKLGAVALSLVLYTGFVFSGSFTEDDFLGLPVSAINQPDGAYPLTQQLGTVDVHYRLSADVPRVDADSFEVTINLAQYDMEQAPQAQPLAITVRSLVAGVEVLEYSPTTVPVALDRIGQKEVPVAVERGEVPEGLAIGTPQLSDRTVVATGPESVLGRVERAVARVQIFESGIDVARQVDLVPVDVDGREVQLVELEPGTIQVEIDVRAVETSKSVPVRPVVTGTLATGFELVTVTVEPTLVTLFGLPDALAEIAEVSTEPISVAGLSESATFEATLSLPEGTRMAADAAAPVIEVEVQPAIATRTFAVGVVCAGVPEGFSCVPQLEQLSVTLRGPAVVLAGLEAGELTPSVDVSGLGAGSYDLAPAVSLPNGVELVSISPGTVPVSLQAPSTPSPSPTPAPG